MKNINLRSVLVIVILISSLSVIYKDIKMELFLLFLTIFLIISKNTSPQAKKKTLRRIKAILKVVVFLIMFQILFRTQGKVIFSLWFIKVTDYGLSFAISSSLRFFIIILIATLLFDYSYKSYLLAFRAWKIPYEISFLIATTIRFIPQFTLEFQNTLQALQLRGINYKKLPLLSKIKLIKTLIFPTLAKTISDVEYMAISLDLRAFRLYPKRTYLHSDKLSKKDVIIQIISVICFLIIIFMRYFGEVT